ncbi:hypothetical protein AMECASPLE_029716, partial [Ameca splendens]
SAARAHHEDSKLESRRPIPSSIFTNQHRSPVILSAGVRSHPPSSSTSKCPWVMTLETLYENSNSSFSGSRAGRGLAMWYWFGHVTVTVMCRTVGCLTEEAKGSPCKAVSM